MIVFISQAVDVSADAQVSSGKVAGRVRMKKSSGGCMRLIFSSISQSAVELARCRCIHCDPRLVYKKKPDRGEPAKVHPRAGDRTEQRGEAKAATRPKRMND